MNREIKFRRYVYDSELSEWIKTDADVLAFEEYAPLCLLLVSSDEVKYCPYIGINDKNGVEIYEGDLLVDVFPVDQEDLSKGTYKSYLPVCWCDKKLMWCVDASYAKDGGFLTSLVDYFGEFLEVAGNIYENPELLKQ